MKRWIKISLAGLGLAGTGTGVAFRVGSANWRTKTSQLIEELEHSVSTAEPQSVSFKEFDQLPAPVAKYFRLVLKEGQPICD